MARNPETKESRSKVNFRLNYESEVNRPRVPVSGVLGGGLQTFLSFLNRHSTLFLLSALSQTRVPTQMLREEKSGVAAKSERNVPPHTINNNQLKAARPRYPPEPFKVLAS